MVTSFTFSCEAGAEASASVEVIAETASARTTAISPSFGTGCADLPPSGGHTVIQLKYIHSEVL